MKSTKQSAIADAGASARRALEELAGAVESIRLSQLSLSEKREELASAPVDKETALARLDAQIAAMKAQGIGEISLAPFMHPAGGNNVTILSGERSDVLMLRSLLADMMRDRLRSRIEAAYGKRAGMSDADRTQALEAIDAELFDLELSEESLIRSAEAAGLPIMRRADADPRAVLAADSELPK